MADPRPQRTAEIKARWEVSMDGETLFNLDDVYGVNQHVYELRYMKVPPDAPELKGIKKSALPDHVRKVQTDVKQWDDVKDSILVGMTKLANDLESFCADSLEAVEQLQEISERITNEFQDLSEKQKEALRSDMDGIFGTLYDNSRTNEERSQRMADRLGSFARLLEEDSVEAEQLREKYKDYIAAKEQEIEEWEKKRGMTPSGDLLKDLQTRIDEINQTIKQKDAEYIAAAVGAGSAGAASLIPPLWIISIPGLIVGSVFAGIRGDELKKLREEIQGFFAALATAGELNTLKFWFGGQKQTFDDLTNHLKASQRHVDNLRGAWQTVANDLSQLIGDTGKLKGLKKDAWLEPISKFRAKTIARVYDKVGKATAVFQKLAFQKPKVEELTAAA
jgi:hypothetical protein